MFRKLALHICIICGIACITAKILDWYNPFMDFFGHMIYVLIVFCVSAAALVISKIRAGRASNLCKTQNRHRHGHTV